MSRAPTKSTAGGRTYLALQKKARQEGRATDELLQLLALETFLDRLSTSPASKDLVLKGGVLLAAYDMRRPTRDVDLSARGLPNSVEGTVELVRTILAQERDDGWTFGSPTGESIREEDEYSGVRVTVPGMLATARIGLSRRCKLRGSDLARAQRRGRAALVGGAPSQCVATPSP